MHIYCSLYNTESESLLQPVQICSSHYAYMLCVYSGVMSLYVSLAYKTMWTDLNYDIFAFILEAIVTLQRHFFWTHS